jgi:hypothetical protein
MISIYIGILAASVFAAIIAWREYRSRVVVHRIDPTNKTLTVKNIGRVGARNVRLLVAESREGAEDGAHIPPGGEHSMKGRRLEDIPPSGLRTIDLDWIKVGNKWANATVCVAVKWSPDLWIDRLISRFFSFGLVSPGDSQQRTYATIPGYSRLMKYAGEER